jgi:hypothetical protein
MARSSFADSAHDGRLLIGDVVSFAEVGRQIIELDGLAGTSEPDGLPITDARCLREPGRIELLHVAPNEDPLAVKFKVKRWSLDRRSSKQHREDGDTVELRRRFLTAQRGHGRQEIPEGPHLVAHRSRRDPSGPSRDGGDADAAFIEVAFEGA